MKQDPPFAVQIELVEGCTLACEFCGVNGIRQRPGNFKYMTIDNAIAIAQRLKDASNNHGWNPRYEFAMHGEPSVHPQLVEIVSIFRSHFKPSDSMVLFSNGSGFMKKGLLNEVLEAGINTIGLDAYEHVNIVPRVMEQYDGKYPVYHYPEQREHNLHSGRRSGCLDIVVIQDISKADVGNHSSLNTHCGGGMEPPLLPVKKRCAKPFRELSIRWDGNVAICCNDFRGIYKISNVIAVPLDELWNHPRFTAARKKLYHADRGFNPCQFCTATSMRVGLLPDHKGNLDLPVAAPHDETLIMEAIAGAPFTPIVLRKWENDGSIDAPLNIIPDKQ